MEGHLRPGPVSASRPGRGHCRSGSKPSHGATAVDTNARVQGVDPGKAGRVRHPLRRSGRRGGRRSGQGGDRPALRPNLRDDQGSAVESRGGGV